jgi:hypothetical protein
MGEVDHGKDGVRDQIVRGLSADVRNEADPAGVVLEPGIVKGREVWVPLSVAHARPFSFWLHLWRIQFDRDRIRVAVDT